MSRALLLGLLALAASVQRPVSDRSEHHLVQVAVSDEEALARLLSLDLDLAGCTGLELGGKTVDVIATEGDIEVLKSAGWSFEVAIRGLERHAASRALALSNPAADALTPPLGQGAMGGHYTLAQMEAFLDSFHSTYPSLCAEKVSIGTSIEGRDIWMVKISDNADVDEPEPEVYYDAIHHAREPLSMEAMILFMDELLSGYGVDPEATYIVDNRELYFVPCVNPDGYAYNFLTNPGGGGLWRKNRRDNGDGTVGVDLNRNYSTAWDAPNGGNSTNTSSSTYRGTAPFSEPETAAVEAFVASRDFVQMFSVHTYTDILLRPWAYQLGDPDNVSEYELVGDALTAENGNAHGGTAEVLYVAAGSALDHHHVVRGALSWTPELGRRDEGGFWPGPLETVEIANRHQPMFRTLALFAGPYLEIETATVTEAVGGNGNGVVEPGEIGEVVVTLRNRGVGAASGSASVTLTSLSSGIALGNAAVVLPGPEGFGLVDNASTPLTFAVPASHGDILADLRLTMSAEGRTAERDLRVVLAPLRRAVDDDMELDRGFERDAEDTAFFGGWERALPQQTTYGGDVIQPGVQHTPGGQLCWITQADAGSSAGSFDVDGGYTDLLSPVFDLSHLGFAELRLWRWYGESESNDPFEAFVSDDSGQSWTRILADRRGTGAWVELVHEMPGPLTSAMRFRFRAQDLDPSLVEAGIDDFALSGVLADGSITLMSSGALGSQVRIGMTGAPGGVGYLFLSQLLSATPTFPGIDGILHLDPASAFPLPPVSLDATGYGAVEVQIPGNLDLVGNTFHWQMVYQAGGELSFSNLQTLTLK